MARRPADDVSTRWTTAFPSTAITCRESLIWETRKGVGGIRARRRNQSFEPAQSCHRGRIAAARGWARLLLDLPTEEKARHPVTAFDISLLGGRVSGALNRVRENADIENRPVRLVGASTGAAAGLVAAAEAPTKVEAVISLGQRPDLAGDWLARVACPMLLIVGSAEKVVLALNGVAFSRPSAKKSLEVVPGARHLFEDLGALDPGVEFAAAWSHSAFPPTRP